jgi:PAS domain S-box-containing protein
VSPTVISFAINVSPKQRQMRAQPISNASRYNYRAKYAIEGTGDGLWDWNIEDNTVFFSVRWKEMLGFSEDEVGNGIDEWESRIHPEDKPKVLEDVQAYLDGNKSYYNNEHRVRCKDGRYKWILDRGMVVNRSPDGKPLRMIGTHIDISQSKQTENDLLEQKRFLSDSQAIAKVGSWMLNIEIGKIIWSDETFKIFGLSHKTDVPPVLSDFCNLLHVDDRLAMEDWLNNCLAGKKPPGLEFRTAPIKGVSRWLYGDGALETNSKGKSLRLIGTVQDITERKLNEEALLASENEFRLLAEAVPQIVWIAQPDGTNIFFNQQWVDYTGLTLQESYGDGWNKPFHPDDRQRAWDAWQKATKNNQHYSLQCRLQRADGIYRWWLVRGLPLIDAAGNILKWFGTCTDIHEIIVVNEALQANKDLLNAIINSTPSCIYAVDKKNKFTLVNHSFAQFLEINEAELIGKEFQDAFPKDIAKKITLDNQQVISTGQVLVVEETIKNKFNNNKRIVKATKFPLRDSQGNVTGLGGVVIDISEHKLAEEKASRINKLYIGLNKCNEAIIHSNSEQKLFQQICYDLVTFSGLKMAWIGTVDANSSSVIPIASFGDNYGYLTEIKITIDEKDKFGKGPVGKTFRNHQPYWCQDFLNDPCLATWHDAGERSGWASLASLPLYRNRNMIGVLSLYADTINFFDEAVRNLMNDISINISHALYRFELEISRNKAEAKLSKLSLAVEQSQESVVITDINATIEYVNDAFTVLTGYKKEEVIGKTPKILRSSKTPPETYKVMWQALNQGHSWDGEFISRRKDGSEYNEHVLISPLKQADGHITHYVAVKLDITEKKKLDQEIERHRHHLEDLVEQRTSELIVARELAETANQAKSNFLANMSHEIRTPMNAILGLTYIMRRSISNKEQALRLQKIDSASRHLLAIINDILDLSKIEVKQLKLDYQHFNLSQLIDNISSMIKESAENKNLTISIDLGNTPLWLYGDPMRLRQALLNYASNAVKFTEKGGIVLRTKLLNKKGKDLLVHFEVEDTGIGIAPENMTRLFKAFEQADTTISRNYGGTGLGLAITSQIAKLMGGEVGVISSDGQGSTFWFTAHLKAGQADLVLISDTILDDAENQLRNLQSTAKLLLVEDNGINVEVAMELFKSVGLTVDSALDGLEAIKKAKLQRYDLILMDMQMPKMDGLEATRLIRQIPGYEKKPIIAMTANAFIENRHACEEAGMNDFIGKPVEPALLYKTVFRWLSGGVADTSAESSQSKINIQQTLPDKKRGVPETSDNNEAMLLANLAKLSGFNVTKGCALLLGNNKMYIKLLNDFVLGNGDDMQKLTESLNQGDQVTSLRLAHTIKGVASTLGAEYLARLSGQLEDKLRINTLTPMTADSLAIEMEEITRQFALLAAILEIPK